MFLLPLQFIDLFNLQTEKKGVLFGAVEECLCGSVQNGVGIMVCHACVPTLGSETTRDDPSIFLYSFQIVHISFIE